MDLFLLSDQTTSQRNVLEYATHCKRNALLTSFLDQTAVALRKELSFLTRPEKNQIPSFLTVADLVRLYYDNSAPPADGHTATKTHHRKEPQLEKRHPAVESCLLTVGQLAYYFGYFGDNPSHFPNVSSSRIVGICTGIFAGIAMASARSLTELLPLAVQMVRISFRTGMLVFRKRNEIEPPASAVCVNCAEGSNTCDKCSWSTVVAGMSTDEAQKGLDAFHTAQVVPLMNRVYVSAVSASAVTISGPPSILARLWAAVDAGEKIVSSFCGRTRMKISVYGPYHASHPYDSSDIALLLGEDSRPVLEQFATIGIVHSAFSGKPFVATNAYEITKQALDEILCRQVRWDALVHEIATVKLEPTTKARVFAVGAASFSPSLISALKRAGYMQSTVIDPQTWMSTSNITKGTRIQDDKIAIVGMSGRFPNSATIDALWELLEKGLDVHREIPSDRFDASAHTDPSGKGRNKTHTPYGCFIDEPGLFDPRFFQMSPREAAQTDPMGRLALTTAYEALEMSGYVPNRTPSTRLNRIGTFYGQTSDDWREINAAEQVDTYFITGGVRAFAPGRINYFFKFSGPSYSIDTACSSSLAAIQLACTSLWAGDCDTACAGGLNVLTNPDIFSGLSKGQFLSKTGSCKTFDQTADGYCRGDACASIVLKRYSDAIADKDNILGCILSCGTNHSAEAISITHPHAGAQAFLYKAVLSAADVDAHEVGYVEMHGTGTQAGDGIEMESVTNVFAPRHRQRKQQNPLYLGAIKANIGHAGAASGVNSVVKVLKMFEKEVIPPNVGIKTKLNKEFPPDMEDRNIHIPVKLTPFRKHEDGSRRLAFLNNFSAAGGNTALLLEEGPEQPERETNDPRGNQLVVVSARSMSALRNNISNLISWIETHPEAHLSDVAYTSTARRIHHNFRVTTIGAGLQQVGTFLRNKIKDTYKPVNGAPKVMFTLTGQGSQYVGVGKDMYKAIPLFHSTIKSLQQIASSMDFPTFLPMFEGDESGFNNMSPVAVQLGLASLQVALASVWKSWGVIPSGVIGHSLGEYAALQIAGVISVSEMIYLVGKRAHLLATKCKEGTHGMVAVRAGALIVDTILGSKSGVEIACVNGPNETVLSGLVADVTAAAAALDTEGIKTTILRVPFAFHSAQVAPIMDDFIKEGRGVTFRPPQIPVFSPLLGRVVQSGETNVFGPEYLAKHARQQVNFDAAVTAAVGDGFIDGKAVWIELGAHSVTGPMVKSILKEVIENKSDLEGLEILPSLRRGQAGLDILTSTVANLYKVGVDIDFDEFHRPFGGSHQLAILPTYAFDSKKYWLDYHNNWTLTKGEKLDVVPEVKSNLKLGIDEASSQIRSIYSTSCQYIVAEEIDLIAQTARVVFESDLADDRLRRITSGHVINGVPLCPSSLNADMAMTAAGYLWKMAKENSKPDLEKESKNNSLAGSSGMTVIDIGLNVCNVEVHTPMIPDDDILDHGRFLIEIEACADFKRGEVQVVFRSKTSPSPVGSLVVKEHGTGKVLYEDRKGWMAEWKRIGHMVKTQIASVQQKGRQGNAHTLQRGLAYRLFASLCEYGDRFRGMSEVIVDSDCRSASGEGIVEPEAVAKIQFQDRPADGTFFCSPYWIDSVCHLSGFVVNSGVTDDRTSNAGQAYISHGWGSIRIGHQLSRDREYTAYVRMQPEDKMMIGDVYVLDGDIVVAVTSGLKFQGVPRRALEVMLPKKKKVVLSAQKANRAPKSLPKSMELSWPSGPTTQPPSAIFIPPALPSRSREVSLVSRAIEIIQAETGVPPSELIDEATFDSLGVDSLMGLTISAKFHDDLEIDVPASIFFEAGTVGALKVWMAREYPERSTVMKSRPGLSKTSTRSSSEGYASDGTDITVPSPEPSISGKHMNNVESYLSGKFAVPRLSTSVTTDTTATVSPGFDPSLPRQIIASEMGIDEAELVPDLILSDMGMDSLMSLSVLGELRDRLDIDLPSDFLLVNSTMAAVEKALGLGVKPTILSSVNASKDPSSYAKSSIERPHGSGGMTNAMIEAANAGYSATSVLLQGSPKASVKLFMIPDGSGSATSYTTLPAIGSEVGVFGLNCPFLKAPTKWTSGIPGLAALYVTEIRRRQPHGPYFVGGWSAGGIIAYEMVIQLCRAGEAVQKLFLIDSPCPINLEPLPARLHEFFDRIGFLGSGPGRAPDWLVPHFQASVRALSAYKPDVLADEPGAHMPEVIALWATDGVCGANSKLDASIVLTGEDPAPMKWLLNDRTDFGDNGWGALFGKDERTGTYKCSFVAKTVKGHHFEILKDEQAIVIARELASGLCQ